jgi:uncharacterized protein (TIGR03032 family)
MSQPTGISGQLRVECAASADFAGWLAQAGGALIVSTYQAGKVAMIGHDGRQVTLLMRQFDKPLGVALEGNRIALATRHDLVVFANAPFLAPDFLEDQPGRYDALYLPRASFHTGDVHVHDVVFQGEDLLFVNTRFSCLARVSQRHNFVPVWKPKFISDLVPEDRCHLNGVAMVDGKPKYATALGTTDAPGAWRETKATGGVVIDVESHEIICGGMAMPHSPRWYDGRLWVENSGTGELWVIDPSSGQADVVCGLPGYLRGLAFVGPYALIGLCKIREKHIFGGLPVQKQRAALRCGVAVIDVRSGAQAGMFEFTAGCEELYDVQFLPGARRPMILNLGNPAVRQAVTNPESSWWLRPSAEIPLEAAGTTGVSQHASPAPTFARPGEAFEITGNLLPDSGIQLEGR